MAAGPAGLAPRHIGKCLPMHTPAALRRMHSLVHALEALCVASLLLHMLLWVPLQHTKHLHVAQP